MKLLFVLFLLSSVALARAQPIDGENVKLMVGMMGGEDILEKAKEIGGDEFVNSACDAVGKGIDIAQGLVEEGRKVFGDEATDEFVGNVMNAVTDEKNIATAKEWFNNAAKFFSWWG